MDSSSTKRTTGSRNYFFTALLMIALMSTPLMDRGQAWSASEAPAKIAVLPFAMHTSKDLLYLQDGIRDMLASRLAWQGKVQVIDRAAVDQATKGISGDMDQTQAVKIGGGLKADYVVFGSVTAIGKSISLDSKMAPVSKAGQPVNLVAQTQSLDDVIPQVNAFAQKINQQVFGRTGEVAQTTTTESEGASTRNPELLVPDTMQGGDRLSYLNPNFLEMTSEDALRQPGLWRSQTFQGGIVGMDVGDFDGDGKFEIVTITGDKVTVLRKEANGLKTLATFNATKVDHFLWVTAVDVDRNGRDEIYVTNLRKANDPNPAMTENVHGSRGFTERLASMGFTMVNGALQVTVEGAPYFLNGIELPGRGRVLIGQEKASPSEGTFQGEIMEMRLSGNALATASPVNVPKRCNVFNFAMGDINNDRSNEIVLVDNSNTLTIVNTSGDQMWKSDRPYCNTTNMFEGRVEDRRYNSVDLYAIPSPILMTDINHDGILEILANRSPDSVARFLPNSMKYYDKSEVASLSWDQLGLVENWKTRNISGMVTSVRLADLDNNGTPELVASLVLAKDFLKLWESKSTIFSYDLNVSAKPGKSQ